MRALAARLADRLSRPGTLAGALLVFVAAAFLLPTEPAYALVFYIAVAPCTLARSRAGHRLRDGGYAVAVALIYWSAATLLWGRDDGHRSGRFLLDAVMTALFLDALMWVAREPVRRAQMASVLIWAGAANAALSIALGAFVRHDGDRLHGWGVTSHPILGASVMTGAYLAALLRVLVPGPPRHHRALHAAACLLLASFILLTGSRGPLGAAAAATVFVCAAGPWRGRALAALAALTAGWFLLPDALRRHQAQVLVARGASHRLEIWGRTLQMVREHPILGNGLAANLDLPGMTFPHDLYLSVLFYSGAVGLALFAALAALVTWRLFRDVTGTGEAGRAGAVWVAALWLAALISGLTDLGQITKGPGPMWFIFWLPVGLVLARPALAPVPIRTRSATA